MTNCVFDLQIYPYVENSKTIYNLFQRLFHKRYTVQQFLLQTTEHIFFQAGAGFGIKECLVWDMPEHITYTRPSSTELCYPIPNLTPKLLHETFLEEFHSTC